MDGYLRVQTDKDGKIVEIWDYWYKDEELEFYMDSCGVDCYLEDYTFTPNSLILITFEYKAEITESYMYGREYDEWLEIVDEIVLIENYNQAVRKGRIGQRMWNKWLMKLVRILMK